MELGNTTVMISGKEQFKLKVFPSKLIVHSQQWADSLVRDCIG